MYKLTDKIEVEIQPKVTPRTLKQLKDLGLYSSNLDEGKEVEVIFDIFTEEKKFKELTNLIFVLKEEPVWDEVSLNEWLRGYKDFFLQLVKSFSTSAN